MKDITKCHVSSQQHLNATQFVLDIFTRAWRPHRKPLMETDTHRNLSSLSPLWPEVEPNYTQTCRDVYQPKITSVERLHEDISYQLQSQRSDPALQPEHYINGWLEKLQLWFLAQRRGAEMKRWSDLMEVSDSSSKDEEVEQFCFWTPKDGKSSEFSAGSFIWVSFRSKCPEQHKLTLTYFRLLARDKQTAAASKKSKVVRKMSKKRVKAHSPLLCCRTLHVAQTLCSCRRDEAAPRWRPLDLRPERRACPLLATERRGRARKTEPAGLTFTKSPHSLSAEPVLTRSGSNWSSAPTG